MRRSEGWHVGGLTVYADTVPVKRDSNSLGEKIARGWAANSVGAISQHTHTYTHTHNHLEVTEHAYNRKLQHAVIIT